MVQAWLTHKMSLEAYSPTQNGRQSILGLRQIAHRAQLQTPRAPWAAKLRRHPRQTPLGSQTASLPALACMGEAYHAMLARLHVQARLEKNGHGLLRLLLAAARVAPGGWTGHPPTGVTCAGRAGGTAGAMGVPGRRAASRRMLWTSASSCSRHSMLDGPPGGSAAARWAWRQTPLLAARAARQKQPCSRQGLRRRSAWPERCPGCVYTLMPCSCWCQRSPNLAQPTSCGGGHALLQAR